MVPPSKGARNAAIPFVTQALKWPIKPLYTPADLDAVGFDYMADLGFPGEYPYTRSTRPNGHRSDFWTMTQVTGFGKGEDWAKRARYMLDQGLSGLILEYDLATTNAMTATIPSWRAKSAALAWRSTVSKTSKKPSTSPSTSSNI